MIEVNAIDTSLVLSAAVVSLAYLLVVNKVLGRPVSISDTYYGLNNVAKGLGSIFTVFCFILSITSLIPMIDFSSNDFQRLLAFISSVSIAFIGASSAFKTSDQGVVHYTSAIVMGLSSQLWMALNGAGWMTSVALVVSVLATCFTGKKYWMYWLEVGLLIATLSKLFTYIV